MMDEVFAGGREGARDRGGVGGGHRAHVELTVSPAFFTLEEHLKTPSAYVEIYIYA